MQRLSRVVQHVSASAVECMRPFEGPERRAALDVESIAEVERRHSDPVSLAVIIDMQSRNIVECISTQSGSSSKRGALYPFRLLDDGSGVELRESHALCYRAVPEQAFNLAKAAYEAAVQKRKADIAHCEKLLRELPIALANSKTAQRQLEDALESGDSDDLAGVGTIRLEQRRLKKEIGSQSQRLERLQREGEPTLQLDDGDYQWREHQLSLDLSWGVHSIGGKVYQLVPFHDLTEIGIANPLLQASVVSHCHKLSAAPLGCSSLFPRGLDSPPHQLILWISYPGKVGYTSVSLRADEALGSQLLQLVSYTLSQLTFHRRVEVARISGTPPSIHYVWSELDARLTPHQLGLVENDHICIDIEHY